MSDRKPHVWKKSEYLIERLISNASRILSSSFGTEKSPAYFECPIRKINTNKSEISKNTKIWNFCRYTCQSIENYYRNITYRTLWANKKLSSVTFWKTRKRLFHENNLYFNIIFKVFVFSNLYISLTGKKKNKPRFSLFGTHL